MLLGDTRGEQRVRDRESDLLHLEKGKRRKYISFKAEGGGVGKSGKACPRLALAPHSSRCGWRREWGSGSKPLLRDSISRGGRS